MKRYLFILPIALILNPLFIKGQNGKPISSTVVNAKDSIPLSYVNVMLYSRDSTFINGTITDGKGCFHIEDTLQCGKYLKLSSIGYTTLYVPVKETGNYLFMNENTEMLSEIVVKGSRNFVKHTSQGLAISMKNNPVASLGSAFNVLSQMPLIDGSTGQLKVLGKGTPEIYINNRLVRDNNELERLSANDIENIEIITQPGARYASNISSVIIIKTKKKDNGIGGEARLSGTKAEVWSSQAGVSLNYRQTNGLDVFGDIQYSDNGFKQKRTYNEHFNKGQSFTTTQGTHRSRGQMLNTSIGGSYDFKDNSIGLKYEFIRTPERTYKANNEIATNANGENEILASNNKENNQSYRHYINAYIQLRTGSKSTLMADADYISGNSKHRTLSEETNLGQLSETIRTANTNTYHLRAFKVNENASLWGGSLDVGGEYSYTESKQYFSTNPENENELFKPSTDNKFQHFGAFYLSYQHSISTSLSYHGGIRYEMTNFSYRQNDKQVDEQSKKYHDVLPNIGISYSRKGLTANLYYKSNISRPDYQSLNSNYSYVSHTLWETGNPLLRTSLRHSIGADFSWKRLMLSAVYARNKRNICSIYEHLSEENINIRKDINLPNYNSYTFTANLRMDFGFWHPMLQGFIQIQDLKYGLPAESYTKPIGQLYISNRLDLPERFYAYLIGVWLSKGNDRTIHSEGTGMVSLLLNKTLGNWSFNAQANDLLSSWRQKNNVHTNGILYNYHIKGASHCFILSVSYKFSKTKKKEYKGKGAANNEIKRL